MLPQLRGLGRSHLSRRYGLADLDEARDDLADPHLRGRLEEVIGVIDRQLTQPGQTLSQLMGGSLDAAKTISSLTLFAWAGLPSAEALLAQLGRRCARTAALLQVGRAGSGPPAVMD